jgi:hypothetical protein
MGAPQWECPLGPRLVPRRRGCRGALCPGVEFGDAAARLRLCALAGGCYAWPVMRFAPRFLLALPCGALALAAAGCGLCGDVVCGACPPALTLNVSDATLGGPVNGLTISGLVADCSPRADLGYTLCEAQVGPGTYQITLQAAGYLAQTVSMVINDDSGDSCCSCGYNPKYRDVPMTPG